MTKNLKTLLIILGVVMTTSIIILGFHNSTLIERTTRNEESIIDQFESHEIATYFSKPLQLQFEHPTFLEIEENIIGEKIIEGTNVNSGISITVKDGGKTIFTISANEMRAIGQIMIHARDIEEISVDGKPALRMKKENVENNNDSEFFTQTVVVGFPGFFYLFLSDEENDYYDEILSSVKFSTSNFVEKKEIEEKIYPVRWIDEGEIKELKDVDLPLLLEKKIDIPTLAHCSTCSSILRKDTYEVVVDNCKDYFYYIDKGFYASSSYDMSMESWFREICYPIKYFQKAVPAKKSYVSDFNLMDDPEGICVLLFGEEPPHDALLTPDCRVINKLEKENATPNEVSLVSETKKNDITLYVKDVEKSMDLYRNKLGVKILHEASTWARLSFNDDLTLNLFKAYDVNVVCYDCEEIMEYYESLNIDIQIRCEENYGGEITKKGEIRGRLIFKILGWGDFNQDGQEEILLKYIHQSFNGSYRGFWDFDFITKNEKGELSIVDINF